jgi:flavin-dependent dehydrogenase
MAHADVLVVGGGPAGASTAFQLARRGVRVRMLERARFPRSKPCAECLSPQASRVLADMGVLTELESQGALLRGMVVRAPSGATARGDYAASHGFKGFRDRGLAIRREILDSTLLDRVRAAGVEVDDRARVTDVVRDGDGRVRGVRAIDASGKSAISRAAFVVGADGLHSVVARRLRLARAAGWPRRLSLIGHLVGVRDVDDYVEMHVERDGFVGIADVGAGVTTVAAVFPQSRATEMSGDRAGFLDRWLASKPHLARRFAIARHIGPVMAIGPFASHAAQAWRPGALLVGDAADFFDPFTGEGIYSALRGGELAADAISRALGARGTVAEARTLKDYDRARRAEFGGKWWVERLVAAGVAIPFVANRAIRSLAADKSLADLLVGVTGDFVPARRVLNLSYLARLFRLPAPLASSARRAPAA